MKVQNHLIRNIAIIAHVDHGKTTLVDAIFRKCEVKMKNDSPDERMMDNNDLERERGITIFSKSASVIYKKHQVNIVDTPGHSDFGGEVERVLNMVDGALLLVDAVDGPMPQTKFVLKKALEYGLRPIVVINKMDRPEARPRFVEDNVFDLFVRLGADDEQCDFPIVYASARDGWAVHSSEGPGDDVFELLDLILEQVPPPKVEKAPYFKMLVSNIAYDSFVGQTAYGRITSGTFKKNDTLYIYKEDGKIIPFRATKIIHTEGLEEKEIMEVYPGDIISLAGIDNFDIGDTISSSDEITPMKRISVEEPTVSIHFFPNNSPFAGREGQHVTSRKLKNRLYEESKRNVSIRIVDGSNADEFIVSGRGTLQLGILIETMRREGFEMEISKPKPIYKEIDGKIHEPFEEIIIDVDNEFSGSIIEELCRRKGEITSMGTDPNGSTRIEIVIPSRGLTGFFDVFMSLSRGTGILNQSFGGYIQYKGDIEGRDKGALVVHESGKVSPYALINLKDRGVFFVRPGEDVYKGMVVGENARTNDLHVNVCKEKKLTNMRASGSDHYVKLPPVKKMSLEQLLDYIRDDELLEITPDNFRIRKINMNDVPNYVKNRK